MNNRPTKLCALPWLLLILVASPSRLPGQPCGTCGGCESCDPCASPCPPATCSILVPQLVTEYEPRWITRYRTETRERMVTVYREVPTTKTVREKYTVLVPEKRTRTVSDTINHPVYGDIRLRITSMTPEVDVRQAAQTVTRLVPVQEERVRACRLLADAGAASPARRVEFRTAAAGGVERCTAGGPSSCCGRRRVQ